MEDEAGFSRGVRQAGKEPMGPIVEQSHGQAREELSMLDLGEAGNRARQRVKKRYKTVNLSLFVLRTPGSFNRESKSLAE